MTLRERFAAIRLRNRCRKIARHARFEAAAALEHLQNMEEGLRELRRLCPENGAFRTVVRLTEKEIELALRPLDDLSCRGSRPSPGLAALEAEVERKR